MRVKRFKLRQSSLDWPLFLMSYFVSFSPQVPLRICNLDDSLAKVLSLEQTDKTLRSLVDSVRDVQLRLESALVQPLLQLLLVLGIVLGSHVLVADNKAPHGDTLGDDHKEVGHGIALAGIFEVVLFDTRFSQSLGFRRKRL